MAWHGTTKPTSGLEKQQKASAAVSDSTTVLMQSGDDAHDGHKCQTPTHAASTMLAAGQMSHPSERVLQTGC